MASRLLASPRRRSGRPRLGAALLVVLLGGGLSSGVVACASPAAAPSANPSSPSAGSSPSAIPSKTSPSPNPTTTRSPSRPVTSPSTQEPDSDQVVIDVRISDGKVDPNGRKVDVPLGATVVLNVTSDIDDEIHAHLGEDDFTLAVAPGRPERGRFLAKAAGSFEVESHELGKIIVILNVR